MHGCPACRLFFVTVRSCLTRMNGAFIQKIIILHFIHFLGSRHTRQIPRRCALTWPRPSFAHNSCARRCVHLRSCVHQWCFLTNTGFVLINSITSFIHHIISLLHHPCLPHATPHTLITSQVFSTSFTLQMTRPMIRTLLLIAALTAVFITYMVVAWPHHSSHQEGEVCLCSLPEYTRVHTLHRVIFPRQCMHCILSPTGTPRGPW